MVRVRFRTGQYSDRYRVSIQSPGLSYSRNMSKVGESLFRLMKNNLKRLFPQNSSLTFSHSLMNKQNNKTLLNVTFEFGLGQLPQCEMLIKVSSALTFNVRNLGVNLVSVLLSSHSHHSAFSKRFSHFLNNARMNAGAPLKPSTIVNVSKFSAKSKWDV